VTTVFPSPASGSQGNGGALRVARPRARIALLADPDSVTSLDVPRASPHLAQYGIAARDDDGIALARMRLGLATWLVGAQDAHFLAGSVGEAHGRALEALFLQAARERPAGVLLLLASGGVRLHEANAAELALGRALRAAVDLRAAGVPILALAVGDVFGGACVLACAADRLGALPGTRLGLSGPKVLETAAGTAVLDTRDAAAVRALYGVDARVAGGLVDAVPDEVAAVRSWALAAAPAPFALATDARQRALAAALAEVGACSAVGAGRAVADSAPPATRRRGLPAGWHGVHLGGGLWRTPDAFVVAPFGAAQVDARALLALDQALLAHVGSDRSAPHVVVLLEDSAGHDVTRDAEQVFLARFLAHHACVLGVLRTRGATVVGVLVGTGHSAAFFANALQADVLAAVPGARVVAMNPDALARVTGLDAARAIEDHPLLGHPVRHLVALGGVARMLARATPAEVAALYPRACG
jgi:malonate decarboxylase beta subunit